MRKPPWLNKKIDLTRCRAVKELLRGLRIHTVCENALCPNISECFGCGTATIMIMGQNCTRACRFCAVSAQAPLPLDDDEPLRVRRAVEALRLKYVVLTSPTRDDLADGGAGHFVKVIDRVKDISAAVRVEVLVPDFGGDRAAWNILSAARADVIAHNIETVPSLYKEVRDRASYARSLKLLKFMKDNSPERLTKSGLMLGLGEKPREVESAMQDLRRARVDIFTAGQYLAPGKDYCPVREYITPERFRAVHDMAFSLGFKHVQAGPYVRSSYRAGTY